MPSAKDPQPWSSLDLTGSWWLIAPSKVHTPSTMPGCSLQQRENKVLVGGLFGMVPKRRREQQGQDTCVEGTVWTQQKPAESFPLTDERAMILCPQPSLTTCWCAQKSLGRWGRFAGENLAHFCPWTASHPVHSNSARSWKMRSITHIQTSQARVYRDHSLQLKAWEFLKEKVWFGAAHVCRGLSKPLQLSTSDKKIKFMAKHIVKMESRLLHLSLTWRDKMHVNVRKEKSLKGHSTSRRNLSK